MPTRNVNLTEQFDDFVQEQISSGEFKNASEVVRAGLRLLKTQLMEDEEKLHLLRTLAAQGFQSLDQGEGLTAASESELRKQVASIGKRAARKSEAKSG